MLISKIPRNDPIPVVAFRGEVCQNLWFPISMTIVLEIFILQPSKSYVSLLLLLSARKIGEFFISEKLVPPSLDKFLWNNRHKRIFSAQIYQYVYRLLNFGLEGRVSDVLLQT